jgi:hypothetical protein
MTKTNLINLRESIALILNFRSKYNQSIIDLATEAFKAVNEIEELRSAIKSFDNKLNETLKQYDALDKFIR